MIRLLQMGVTHRRLRPCSNNFRYTALYLMAPVKMLSTRRRVGLLSINRANLFSLRNSDYGDPQTSPAQWIREVLLQWRVGEADGEVQLMTMPRVLGYAFNPVSFWFCYDRAGGLRAVLVEVNNTFGERHSYLCFHEDRRPIQAQDALAARKAFHVSPFMTMQGTYTFRFATAAERISVAITLANEDGAILHTAVAGPAAPLTSRKLLRTLLANPLYPIKVIGLIHFQALRLYLKGVRHYRKPPPPAAAISR